MTAMEFKISMRKIKSSLNNITLQLVSQQSVRPYTNNLFEFGKAVLREESNGNSFAIKQAWTTSGIVSVNSINQLAQLLVTGTVTGIQFETYRDYSTCNFADCLKNCFGTTE